jgi:hypothetical protein
MSREINEQRNVWGTAGEFTVNAQRADLWAMDLSNVVRGLNAQIFENDTSGLDPLDDVPTYFVQSITLPELKVNAEAFRRESRPYMMPLNDEPVGEIKVRFYLENPTNPQGSVVYRLLDTWRAFVRGGRGAYSKEGVVPQLNSDFTLHYAFNTSITLYRGSSVPQFVQSSIFSPASGQTQPVQLSTGVTNDLIICSVYQLPGTWLSSFRLTELNYTTGNQLLLIEASLFADDVLDLTPDLNNLP